MLVRLKDNEQYLFDLMIELAEFLERTTEKTAKRLKFGRENNAIIRSAVVLDIDEIDLVKLAKFIEKKVKAGSI